MNISMYNVHLEISVLFSARKLMTSPFLEVRVQLCREKREESLAERGELGVLSSHHCSITLIVTVKLLGRNKLV